MGREKDGNVPPNDIAPMSIPNDRARYLGQKLGLFTDSDPVVLTAEEQQELNRRRAEIDKQQAVKKHVDFYFKKNSALTEESLLESLRHDGVTDDDLLGQAITYFRGIEYLRR